MQFFDRETELSIIRTAVTQPHCFVVLTGRRRIGKTRLVREALKGIEHIELFIPRKRTSLVLENLRASIREQTGYAPSFSSLKEVFEYCFRVEKKPVFIDELSNLAYVDNGTFSDLQELIDREKENWNIRLVVDGSYVSMMEKIFKDQNEPLFGRATNLLDLAPLPVGAAVQMAMAAGFGFVDALEAYSLLGGVPRYLEILPQYRNMSTLKKEIFLPGSIFLTEGENVLIQEFGASWDTYFSILEVIAERRLGPSAIANQLDMPVQMLPKYLQTLRELRLIQRWRPLLGKARHVRYQIQDPFFQVWFEVCYPRINRYRDGSAVVHSDKISSALGKRMEQVVMEIITNFSTSMVPFEPDAVGGWWDRSGHEIDILAYSKKRKALAAGEVKWTTQPTSFDVVERLIEQLKLVDWYNNTRSEHLFICSKSGFSKSARKFMGLNNIVAIGIEELQNILLTIGQGVNASGSRRHP